MADQNVLRTAVDADLEAYDFPAEAILGGAPSPRGTSVRHEPSAGGSVVAGIFALEPGTIRADVAPTETIHVLEGEIHIEFESGESIDLGPGDVALFPPGTVTTRTIKSPYKELYVHAKAP
jgi:uncharacterized cupin superfamily protein